MRYLKVIRHSLNANSEKNLILRQQSALKLLKLINKKSRLINIDETWIGESDFRRRKWQVKGISNSLPLKGVRPRITLIAAVDTHGQKYLSLLQANSNSDIMRIYLENLVEILDIENKSWRKTNVVFWDNASYHSSRSTREVLKRLQIPIMYLGPYGYFQAPCELFFGQLKSQQLNPE